MAHHVQQSPTLRSRPASPDPAMLGQASFKELENFGLHMLDKVVASNSYRRMLMENASNRYSNAIDRRNRLHEYANNVIKPKSYQRYATSLKPVNISREESLSILDALKTLERSGLNVAPQDPAFDELDNATQSLQHLPHLPQLPQPPQTAAKGTPLSATEQWVGQLVDTRKLGTNYHITPAADSPYIKNGSNHGKPFSRCSVHVHPAELKSLIALMPEIFARYGGQLRQAKMTAPATQGERSESMIFYFIQPDDQNQTVTRDLFRFLRQKLPRTSWESVAPGMMSIVDNGVMVGGYAEECYPLGKPRASLGARRAAQVTQAIENCLSKYPGDLASCKSHFAEELEEAMVNDGYNPNSPALLIR